MSIPDTHLAVLVTLAEHYENAHKHFCRATDGKPGKIGTLYADRAAAIRWILGETAYSCDATELPV